MKKLLLLFGILLMFGCQTEPVDIEPTNLIETADFKHQLPAKADSIQIAKNVFQKRHSNGVIEITHYDYLDGDVTETTTDYLTSATVSPTVTVGTGMETVTITGSGFGTEKGYVGFGNGQRKVNRWQIPYWSDNEIRVTVPAGAYSGVVNVYLISDTVNPIAQTNSLTIKYGVYPTTVGYDDSTWRWQRVAFDGPEMVWHPEIGAYDSNIVNLVQQAFDEWTKVSGVNWRIGEPVAIDANSSASDGNFVFGFGPSPGAAHNSMAVLNCGDDTVKVIGGRVVFDEKRDWVAALHEFGHAIGLPHTNNGGSCMVTTGGKSISTWDAEGARDKVNWTLANKPSCATQYVKGSYTQTYTYYKDVDGDGYGGSTTITVESSTPPSGYVTKGGDCDDNNSSINPGATEIKGNGIDENCNGMRDDRVKGNGGGGSGGGGGNGHGPKKN